MTRVKEFKCIARGMSDALMDEAAAAKFTEAYAKNAYQKSMNDRVWCIKTIKGFYLTAERERKAARTANYVIQGASADIRADILRQYLERGIKVTYGLLDELIVELPDGVPCLHRGCLNHVTHPCENCGRIAGKNKS